MNDQAIQEIVDECEERWSRSGLQRITVMRLRKTLEHDLRDRDDARLTELLADTDTLARTWLVDHRDLTGRIADALGYGVLLVAVFLAISHAVNQSLELRVGEMVPVVFGVGGALAWLLTDVRWRHFRDPGGAFLRILWPLGVAAVAALAVPAGDRGGWPWYATATLVGVALAEIVWSWRREVPDLPSPSEDDIGVFLQSVRDRGSFLGWPRSDAVAIVGELRRHLLDAAEEGKMPVEVAGLHPEDWIDAWAIERGVEQAKWYGPGLVIAGALASMAIVTFPFLVEGTNRLRMDFTLFVGLATGFGGWVVARHLSTVYLSVRARRRHRARSLAIFGLGSALLALASRAGLEWFGEFSAPVGWAVPITFMAAVALWGVGWRDPFRR